MGATFVLSFQKWDLISPSSFVGLGNYVRLFHDQDFWVALGNTAIFAVGCSVPCIILALGLALALNSKRVWGNSVLQGIFFLPVVVSMVPVSIVWKWIYDPSLGILNYLLSLFGMSPRAWLIYRHLSLFSIIVMTIWKTVGYYMVIFLVGLKDIPKTFYEAAEIDGATGYQSFRQITLPLLKPITLFVTVMSTINSLMIFTQVYVMTAGEQGSPGNTLRVLVYDMFEKGFRFYQMGTAAAEAVILFAIILGLTFLQFRIMPSSE
jgi:multiple sugar transport system permease protein